MLRNLLLIAFLFFLNAFGYRFSGAQLYSQTSSFLQANGPQLGAYAILLSLVLVGGSHFFTNVGLYKIAYLLSNVVYHGASFLIMAISFLHCWLWFNGEYHLFLNGGYLGLLVLFLLLIASLFSMKVFDFNHHMQNALVNNFAVVVVAVLFVELVGPIFFS